ncbi:MAG: hypothetical protein AAF604_03170 [Acidobacteriota bacterium]
MVRRSLWSLVFIWMAVAPACGAALSSQADDPRADAVGEAVVAAAERAEVAAERAEQAAMRGDRASKKADTLVGAMQVFVAVLAFILVVAGSIGLLELRNLREARQQAEAQVAEIRKMRDSLGESWARFVREALERLEALGSYIDGTHPEMERTDEFLDADRVAIVGDALGLARDPNTRFDILFRLGRHWKSQGFYARALQRFERSRELAVDLNASSCGKARALNFMALTLIEWAETLSKRSTQQVTAGHEDSSRSAGASLLQEAEGILVPLLGAGAEVSVETLFVQGKLEWAQRRLDQALGTYAAVIERARNSADEEERADGYRAIYNTACALCDRRKEGDLYRAMGFLESLPRSEGWARWAGEDEDLQPLRDDPNLGPRFERFTFTER